MSRKRRFPNCDTSLKVEGYFLDHDVLSLLTQMFFKSLLKNASLSGGTIYIKRRVIIEYDYLG